MDSFDGSQANEDGSSAWARMLSQPIACAIALWTSAIGLRVWILIQPDVGYDWDMSLFSGWARGLNELGMKGFYDSGAFCDYPPVLVLLVRGVGWILSAFFSEPSDLVYKIGLKSLAVTGDLAIGFLLWRQGTRLFGAGKGLLVCGLYLLNPVSIYDSAVWGQFDSIYSVFLVAALMFAAGRRWVMVGLVSALALTSKFQSIAVLPLVVLETFRVASFPGLKKFGLGFLIALGIVFAPFVATDTLSDVWERAYVAVVGQYDQLTNNAFNVWSFAQDPTRTDTLPPLSLVRAVAGGRESIAVDESPFFWLTFRRISMVIFALAVALVLSLYSRKPGVLNLWGAGGLLVMSFYLFPTEMHERYAYPAVALLAPWAVSSMGRERLYWALTFVVTLNLVAVLPVVGLARQIGAVSIAIYLIMLVGLAAGMKVSENGPLDMSRISSIESRLLPVRESRWITGFRRATAMALLGAMILALAVYTRSQGLERTAFASSEFNEPHLTPVKSEQGWGELGINRTVVGGPLCLGNRFYGRGLGTHAPASLTLSIPAEAVRFNALVGVDEFAGDRASVRIQVEVDGKPVFESERLTQESDPIALSIEVVGGRFLSIHIDNGGDGNRSDHVNIVEAKFSVALVPR